MPNLSAKSGVPPPLVDGEGEEGVAAGDGDVLLAVGGGVGDGVGEGFAAHGETPEEFARRVVQSQHVAVARGREDEAAGRGQYTRPGGGAEGVFPLRLTCGEVHGLDGAGAFFARF